ncbi:MAG: EAL domain-containing protein [Acidimicrobiia bacterium]
MLPAPLEILPEAEPDTTSSPLPSLERWLRERAGSGAGTALALIGIGIDHFREVNAALGRRGADRLLSDIAGRLQAAAAAGDAEAPAGASPDGQPCDGPLPCVTQLAGPTFAVVVSDPPPGLDLLATAERLRRALDQPVPSPIGPMWLTATVGVVQHHGPVQADRLVAEVDAAVAAAKRYRRGGVLQLERDRHAPPAEHLRLRADLQAALGTDQLSVAYQPVLSLDHTQVQGVEALVRWQHPTAGLLLPSQFLPSLSSSPLATALTGHVLDRALAQRRRWQDEGLVNDEFTVAVNVRAGELSGALEQLVAEALERHGVAPRALQLELSQATVRQEAAVTARTATALRALGVQLALDGAGTAAAPLTDLLAWPADVLKIDRSLSERVGTDHVAAAVVAAMVTVAQSLGLGLVAKGVETAPTAEALRELAVPSGQGCLWSPPLSAADAHTWLAEYRLAAGR